MKPLLLTAALFYLVTAFGAPKKYALKNSTANWLLTSNWSPVGLPQDGDTMVIPAGLILTLADDISLKNAYIDIYGGLLLTGNSMKAILTENSTINVHTTGWIDGDKASQQVLLGGIILKGNDPILIGPKIATATSNGFVPYTEFTVLPVTFVSFTVAGTASAVLVNWSAADETSGGHYNVQRSADGATWTTIATVPAAGNSLNEYSYSDKNTSTAVYYRIKQTGADGHFMYSMVRLLKREVGTAPSVIAHQGKVTVLFAQPLKGAVTIDVFGFNGTQLIRQTVRNPAGSLQLSTGLKGAYLVRICNGQDVMLAKSIFL